MPENPYEPPKVDCRPESTLPKPYRWSLSTPQAIGILVALPIILIVIGVVSAVLEARGYK